MVARKVSARDEVLGRVRAAIGARPDAPAVLRSYRRAGSASAAERTSLFCARVGDYRARVVRAVPSSVAEAVAAAVPPGRFCVPEGVPAAWVPATVERVADAHLTPKELDRLDGVLTGCTVAIAETGTIVLTAGPREGRRALTLVPDRHVVVVAEEQIVELVPEALDVVGRIVREERRPVTFVAGPSATSDIELDRVEGVHGPRDLVVVVMGGE